MFLKHSFRRLISAEMHSRKLCLRLSAFSFLLMMLIVCYAIQRLEVHRSAIEVKSMMHDLNVEAIHKHARGFDD